MINGSCRRRARNPVSAYVRSVRACAGAFTQPGALIRVLDYPLGRVTGQQALAVRTTDTVIHTWDLARAIGTDDTLDAGLVTWISESLDEIYAGLAETPTATETTHQFFAAPRGGDLLASLSPVSAWPRALPGTHRPDSRS